MPHERSANAVLAELFHIEGIHTSFMYLSEDMMRLAARMADYAETEIVQSRHEQDAVTMADGYARHTTDIGLAVVGQGGAIGQTGSSLVTARKRGSSLLVVAPEASRTLSVDNPTTYSDPTPGIAAKDFDQTGYLRDTIEQVRSVRAPEVLVPTFKEVIRKLRLGDGPMAVTVSTDVLNGDMVLSEELRTALDSPVEIHSDPGAVVSPSDERVERAVEAFLNSDASRHPLIVLGRGAAREEYRPAIEALAERMGAVLTTTFRGTGYLHGHPFYAGTIGESGGRVALEYAAEADYVLALGASLNPRTTDAGRVFDEDATIVHADVDEGALGRYGPLDIGIHGDAGVVAERLDEALAAAGIHRADALWTETAEARLGERGPFDHVEFTDRDDALDPRQLVLELDGILPENRVGVVDGGHFSRWVYQGITFASPDHLICRGDFSSVGLGLPMSLGAAVGTDADTTPVLFCGDGGLLMHAQELSTAARYDLPLIVVCFNDDALAAEYHLLAEDDRDIARTEAPNIAEAAAGLGCTSHRVRTPADLSAVAEHIDHKPDGPVVLDCIVDRAVKRSM